MIFKENFIEKKSFFIIETSRYKILQIFTQRDVSLTGKSIDEFEEIAKPIAGFRRIAVQEQPNGADAF